MFTATLPLKPYLKKYLIRKCKITQGKLVITPAMKNDQIGFSLYIIELLNKKRNYYMAHNKEDVTKFIASLTDSIEISLDQRYATECGMFIHPEKVFYINSFIEKAFRNEMFGVINGNCMYNPNLVIKNIIYDFCGIYDITEDDLSIDTIYKVYQRYKDIYSYIR